MGEGMTQQKKPAAGEWWFCQPKDRHLGDRVYIVGISDTGKEVFQADKGGQLLVDWCGWIGWHHEPECTGWDWPPAETTTIEVSPGDGWRWLEDDEWICSEDEYFAMGVGQFFKVSDSVGELASLLRKLGCPARRRIPTTRTIKLCSVVYWDRPEAPMSTILTEQELERHRKAWRTMHVVSETTVEVPL
jgi:hypothetical protein